LLTVEGHQLFFSFGLDEFIFLKAFVILDKTVMFSKHTLNFITPFIVEHIKVHVKRVVAQLASTMALRSRKDYLKSIACG
jgi:hypothetical protein